MFCSMETKDRLCLVYFLFILGLFLFSFALVGFLYYFSMYFQFRSVCASVYKKAAILDEAD